MRGLPELIAKGAPDTVFLRGTFRPRGPALPRAEDGGGDDSMPAK